MWSTRFYNDLNRILFCNMFEAEARSTEASKGDKRNVLRPELWCQSHFAATQCNSYMHSSSINQHLTTTSSSWRMPTGMLQFLCSGTPWDANCSLLDDLSASLLIFSALTIGQCVHKIGLLAHNHSSCPSQWSSFKISIKSSQLPIKTHSCKQSKFELACMPGSHLSHWPGPIL